MLNKFHNDIIKLSAKEHFSDTVLFPLHNNNLESPYKNTSTKKIFAFKISFQKTFCTFSADRKTYLISDFKMAFERLNYKDNYSDDEDYSYNNNYYYGRVMSIRDQFEAAVKVIQGLPKDGMFDVNSILCKSSLSNALYIQ